MVGFKDNYGKKCKVTQGKVKTAYIFQFLKYSRAQIRDFEMKLTAFPTTIIYSFDVEGSFTQSSSFEDGNFFFEHSLNLRLSEVYDVLDIHTFLKVDYRVIVETYNNQLLIFGVRNGLTAKVTNQSGSGKGEFNGFELNFTGKEEKSALLVSSLEDFFFIVFDNDGYFNYDLNIDF